MSDMIRRSALLRYIDDQIEESKEELDDAKTRGNERDVAYNCGEIAEAERIKRCVNMLVPAVDAVPVVRCKECIHAIKFRSGTVSCGYHDWCRILVKADGYCDHGERD